MQASSFSYYELHINNIKIIQNKKLFKIKTLIFVNFVFIP